MGEDREIFWCEGRMIGRAWTFHNPRIAKKLGMKLQAYFDDIRKEGVPDRFKDLLRQIDARKNGESD